MVALSNERANTLFVLGDTPMRLGANGTDLLNYATNNGGLGLPTEDGLTIGSAYAAVFYPSCQTTDLSGNTVVTAPTHMMVRTILRSDAVSYPWKQAVSVGNNLQVQLVQASEPLSHR